MNSINIKVYLPWYARGTPVINPRDGPGMALSDKPLIAIREGPSARGKPGECINAVMRECRNEDGRQNPVRYRGEAGRPEKVQVKGFYPPWLTLKTVFFNMQNGVFSQWYARL